MRKIATSRDLRRDEGGRRLRDIFSCRGQSLIEATFTLLPLAILIGLLLWGSFHSLGWTWSRYWVYQGLHCLFEKNKEPISCSRRLDEMLSYFPGRNVVTVRKFGRKNGEAHISWSYQWIGGSIPQYNTWTLEKPQPHSRAKLSRGLEDLL